MRRGQPKKWEVVVLCGSCGTEFTRRKKDQVYCSAECQRERWRKRGQAPAVRKRAAKTIGDTLRGRPYTTGAAEYVRRDGDYEHRTIMKRLLGRDLLPGEVVHHLDHDKRNNDPSNLAVMDWSEHMREHVEKYQSRCIRGHFIGNLGVCLVCERMQRRA